MDINRLHILTDEQLVKMAQEGSDTAEEILIEKYKGMVKNKAKTYYIAGADSEDVVQEGMIGLFKAIRSFDAERQTAFKTFADTCVNSQILSAIKKANRKRHKPLNESVPLEKNQEDEKDGALLDQMINTSSNNDPEVLLIIQEIMDYLRAYDNRLFSDFERQVLREKMKGMNYIEIAELLGRSPKSVDNALQRIKKKIVAYIEK